MEEYGKEVVFWFLVFGFQVGNSEGSISMAKRKILSYVNMSTVLADPMADPYRFLEI